MATPNGRTGTRATPTWRAAATTTLVAVVLPLAVFYVLRSQGYSQWLALTLSGAVPAVRMIFEVARRRHVNGFEAFVIGMLVVRVVTSLLTGSARVVLVKDAGLGAAAGLWILGSLLGAKPFAFQAGQSWQAPTSAAAREAAWHASPALRSGLNRLTVLWGCAQLLDGAAGMLLALLLPVEAVPVVNRAKGLTLQGAVLLATLAYSRRYGRRHALSLFGSTPLTITRTGRKGGRSP
ncbi:VC0807 family protein [Streptomyces sp. NPDC059650]|uniref:VC0807 family protein n=1 Tax=Streptomyces sp. NPDC059650 TaxID=3346896 RepID=UPI00368574BA